MDMNTVRKLAGFRLLTAAGRYYFESAVESDPSRKVGVSSLLSLSGDIPSKKLGKTIQYDSASNEKFYVLLAELDEQVQFLIDQPPKISVMATNAIGRTGPRLITVDYIEAATSQFSLVEAKRTEDLFKLRAKSPSDWIECANGNWRYLPGEETASTFGMRFKVFRPEAYSKAYLANLAYQFRLPESDCLNTQAAMIVAVRKHLARGPQSVRQLCERYQGLTGGLILRAVLGGLLSGLLDLQPFDREFMVFQSTDDAEMHRSEISRMGLIDHPMGPLALRLLRASTVELEYAHRTMASYDRDRAAGLPRTATDYRIEKRLREVLSEGASRIAAFIPNFQGRGGTGTPIDVKEVARITSQIKTYWKDAKRARISGGFGTLEHKARESGAYLPSPETYRKLFHRTLAPEKAAFMAGGKRAFHQARPIVDGRDAIPRLKICGMHVHVDGVYGDAYSREAELELFLRPIYYPIIDDLSAYVFSRGIKIGRPSRLPVGMAIRDCYLRHGALPAEITRDWGSEFDNNFYDEMAGGLNFINQRRPKGAPRFGGRGESFNASFSAFLQTIAGGSYFDKAGRAADGSKKGRKHAAHEISALVRIADNWIFNVWNKTPIAGESKSPAELFAESRRMFPDAFVPVTDTAYTRYLTSVPLKVGKFDYSRGARFGGVRYSSRELTAVLRRNEEPADPRLDCMDPSLLWVKTSHGVIGLHSREHVRIGGMDIGSRMDELSRLLNYQVNSKANHRERNVAEAALREQIEESMHAVSQSQHSVSPDIKPRPDGAHEESAPDFTGFSHRDFVPLRRFGDGT